MRRAHRLRSLTVCISILAGLCLTVVRWNTGRYDSVVKDERISERRHCVAYCIGGGIGVFEKSVLYNVTTAAHCNSTHVYPISGLSDSTFSLKRFMEERGHSWVDFVLFVGHGDEVLVDCACASFTGSTLPIGCVLVGLHFVSPIQLRHLVNALEVFDLRPLDLPTCFHDTEAPWAFCPFVNLKYEEGDAGIHAPRVVVSMTTLPCRINFLYQTINSIKTQTYPPDAIYVNLPRRYVRMNHTLDVPGFLQNDPNVTVLLQDEDLGPIQKLLPILRVETAPTTRIITVDDDEIYDVSLVERLLQWSLLYSDAALGHSSGWNGSCLLGPHIKRLENMEWDQRCNKSVQGRTDQFVFVRQANTWACKTGAQEYGRDFCAVPVESEIVPVDVLEGIGGVLYVRGTIPDEILHPKKECFTTDDVRICGTLAKHGVARFVVPQNAPPGWSTKDISSTKRTYMYETMSKEDVIHLGLGGDERVFEEIATIDQCETQITGLHSMGDFLEMNKACYDRFGDYW